MLLIKAKIEGKMKQANTKKFLEIWPEQTLGGSRDEGLKTNGRNYFFTFKLKIIFLQKDQN